MVVGSTNTISLNQGEKVYFRNNSGKWNYYDRDTSKWICNCFSATYSHSAGGNVNSLGDYANMDSFSLPYGFLFNLFGVDASTGDTTLNDISDLRMPNTTMSPYCYKNIFSNCTGITSIPSDLLPATTLETGCYMWLFQNTGITSLPSGLLPATVLSDFCYNGMFESCANLVTVPSDFLPATTLATNCYGVMFIFCTALTNAPSLPATTLTQSCYYQMFRGCTALTTAPDLPATTLAQACYRNMFYGCTSLNRVTTYANTISAYQCTDSWLYGVAATGDFYNIGTATYSSGANGIPSGWNTHRLLMRDVVLTPVTGTEYSVTAKMKWSNSFTWDSAEIDISNIDQGAGNSNAYLTFTPSETSNYILTATNNIDIYFNNPDTWFTLTVYNNGTVVDTQIYVPYTINQ